MILWRDFDRWCERRTGSPGVSALSAAALLVALLALYIAPVL